MDSVSDPLQPALWPDLWAESDDLKRCRKCKRRLPHDAFPRKRGRAVSPCKDCTRASKRLYNATHREERRRRDALTVERRRAVHRAWWQRNSARLQAKRSAAYYANHEVAKENNRRYYARTVERRRALLRHYYSLYKEARRASGRAKRLQDVEAWRLKKRLWWHAYVAVAVNRARANATARSYRSRHPEKVKAWKVRHRAKDPEAYRLKKQRHRLLRLMRQKGATGWYTQTDLMMIYAAQNGQCAYCRTSLDHHFCIEHMTPVVRGGSNWPCNLALSCARCNSRKHDKTAGEFLALLIREARCHR